MLRLRSVFNDKEGTAISWLMVFFGLAVCCLYCLGTTTSAQLVHTLWYHVRFF